MAKKILKRTSVKTAIKARRRRRIRSRLEGNDQRPRLCITRSNRRLVVQVIDDINGVTLGFFETPKGKSANVETAKELGKSVAAGLKEKGLLNVVFDRSGNLFHGKVAAIASAAREAGLKF